MRIYLAGPLFTAAERAFNARLRDLLLAAGFEVWLPQDREPRKKSAAAIFSMDVEGIEWSDVIVANMDGADPDSGTCWECGYAYRKKKIIVFRTDFRSAGEGGTLFQPNVVGVGRSCAQAPAFQFGRNARGEIEFCSERERCRAVSSPTHGSFLSLITARKVLAFGRGPGQEISGNGARHPGLRYERDGAWRG